MKVFYQKTSAKFLNLSNTFILLVLIITTLTGKVTSGTYGDLKSDEIMSSIQFGILSAVEYTSLNKENIKPGDYWVSDLFTLGDSQSTVPPYRQYKKCEFRSFSPKVFQHVRQIVGVKDNDFISSIYKLSLKKIETANRSGALFYKSGDDKYIIKSVKKKEAKFLIESIFELKIHIKKNPSSLLPRFFGLYSFSRNSTTKMLVVMNNFMPSNIPLDQMYDLKGSTYHRDASDLDKKAKIATQKDNDFIRKHPAGIYVEEKLHTALSKILKQDCQLLESLHVTDYSLLLGIYNIDHERKQNLGNIVEKTQIGIPALNPSRENLQLFMGTTDILTYYGIRKKIERVFKSTIYGNSTSLQSPDVYAERFHNFITKSVLIPTQNV